MWKAPLGAEDATSSKETSHPPSVRSPAPEAADPLFDTLCQESGTTSLVCLAALKAPSQRGLRVTQAVPEGTVVLDIPFSCCIVEPQELPPEVEEEMGGLPEGFTWDVRLAIKLLEAVEGRWSSFWTAYARLFPAPHAMALPFLLPPALQQELHHPDVAAAAAAQQERLRELFPDMVPAADAPPEAYPSPLLWAWALVRSRAFICGDRHFAFVPFLDMANHASLPTANFEVDLAARRYRLRALRALRAGEEVTITYGERLDNQRLFSQYGFVQPEGNASDRLAIGEPLQTISRRRLEATLQGLGVDAADWQ
eukprot:EG_transcript_12905